MRLAAELCPDPLIGELTALTRHPSWFLLLREREGDAPNFVSRLGDRRPGEGGVMYDSMGCFSELFHVLLGCTSLKSLKPKKN